MPEQTVFEARLADAFDRYVAPAPVEVDAHALARSVVAGATGRRWRASGLVPRGRWLVVLAAALLVAALAAAVVGGRVVEPPTPTSFKGELLPTGSMQVPRTGAAVTTLLDGRVLVVGGSAGGEGQYRFGEVWDPSTSAFTATSYGTSGQVAMTLVDGRAIVIGGPAAETYEIYDPATGRSAIRCCDMGEFTTSPAAALLADGRVLLVAGTADRSARLFDPVTYASSPTGPMTEERVEPQTISLQDGRVLVLGGGPLSAELYDPATGIFTPTDSPGLRSFGPAVLLGDGRVLVTGSARFERTAPAVVFDPATGHFDAAVPTPNHVAGAAPIGGGRALLVGDYDGPAAGVGTWAVVYDPEVGVVQELPAPTAYHPSVAALPDGRVLLVGGYDIDGEPALDIAEIYR